MVEPNIGHYENNHIHSYQMGFNRGRKSYQPVKPIFQITINIKRKGWVETTSYTPYQHISKLSDKNVYGRFRDDHYRVRSISTIKSGFDIDWRFESRFYRLVKIDRGSNIWF